MKIKKSDLKKIIMEALEDAPISDLDAPATRRELLGDAIADVLDDALYGYLREMKVPEKEIYNIKLDVETLLLKVAVHVSRKVGEALGWSGEELRENIKQ